MRPQVRAALFDYDDTLVDTFHARMEAANRAVARHLDGRVDLERMMREWAGRPQMDIWLDLTGGDAAKARAMMETYRRWYWAEGTYTARVFTGIPETLRELKGRGYLLGVVTSKARLMHDEEGRPYGALVEMERLGMDPGLFDVFVGWPDVEESKPSPRPVLYALEKLGLPPAEGLMVGDSHIDVLAAHRAGALAAGAAWGTNDRRLLEKARPEYVLEEPADLCRLLPPRRR